MNQLIDFQEFLLETFYENTDVSTLQKKLSAYKVTHLRDWISSAEPAMLEVAARMIQSWAKKVEK